MKDSSEKKTISVQDDLVTIQVNQHLLFENTYSTLVVFFGAFILEFDYEISCKYILQTRFYITN